MPFRTHEIKDTYEKEVSKGYTAFDYGTSTIPPKGQGRPRKHKSNAARQKSYRDRKRVTKLGHQ